MSGQLSLGDVSIDMAEAQTQILLIFAKKANQLVSHDKIASQLWPKQQLSINHRRNVTLSVHRLREVFAIGPLGRNVIRSIYRKGYVLTASVEVCPPPYPQKIRSDHPSTSALVSNPFYGEAHDYWPNRDPYKLRRQEWLLQKSLQLDPSFGQAYLELCYFKILQCYWGMRSSQAVLPSLQQLLSKIDQITPQPSGWLAIKAEVQSLLLWQPLTTQRLYGTWLADTLPRGMPLMSWARHLIFTGNPRSAIQLLKQHVEAELCHGWLELAMAYCAIGDFHAGEEAIQRQLSLDPTMVGTRLLWALLLVQRGQSDLATRILLDTGILERPFQGIQSVAAYTLAQGTHHQRAQDLLDEAMTRIGHSPSQVGALGYWGLAALALGRDTEAIQLLKLSVSSRCYSAPVIFATPFLKPYADTSACRLFVQKMRQSFPTLN
jgi:DNA-binding winged helix-turn-helix (wHTH) protein